MIDLNKRLNDMFGILNNLYHASQGTYSKINICYWTGPEPKT